MHPIDGNCQCDRARGWFHRNAEFEPWVCSCRNEFITEDGFCIGCVDVFPLCEPDGCKRVGGLDMDTPNSFKHIGNDEEPQNPAGTYICDVCKDEWSFVNPVDNRC